MRSAVKPVFLSASCTSALPRSSRRTCPASPCEHTNTGSSTSAAATRGRTSGHRHAAGHKHQPERLQSSAPAAALLRSHSTSPRSTRPRPRRRACRAPCGSSSALWGQVKKEHERTEQRSERPAATYASLSAHSTAPNNSHTHFWHSLLQYSRCLQAEQRNTASRAWQQAHGGMVRVGWKRSGGARREGWVCVSVKMSV